MPELTTEQLETLNGGTAPRRAKGNGKVTKSATKPKSTKDTAQTLALQTVEMIQHQAEDLVLAEQAGKEHGLNQAACFLQGLAEGTTEANTIVKQVIGQVRNAKKRDIEGLEIEVEPEQNLEELQQFGDNFQDAFKLALRQKKDRVLPSAT